MAARLIQAKAQKSRSLTTRTRQRVLFLIALTLRSQEEEKLPQNMNRGTANGLDRNMDCSGCITPLGAHAIMQITLLSRRRTVEVRRACLHSTQKYKMHIGKRLRCFYIVLRWAEIGAGARGTPVIKN